MLNKCNFILLFLVIQLFLPFNSMVLSENHTIPDAIIELPESENAIIVEKKTQTLSLYTSKSENLLIDFTAPCSTGEAYGIKQKAGDKKTPEGIYFLKDEYEDKYLSAIYGQKAFPTDYPNFIDKRSGKNGSAIWIHGTNKKLKPFDSNGCVVLENFNIQKLSNYINLDSTPVIMVDIIKMVDKERLKQQKNDINKMISQWIQALETGTYHDYLSFYASKHLPGISWWTDWFELREKKVAGKSGPVLEVKKSRIGIYYHDQLFVALFDYYLTLENRKILLGKRKLFLEYQKGDYKITGDVFQRISKKLQGKKVPLIAAAKILFY